MLWIALRMALRSAALRDSAATRTTTGSMRRRYCSRSSSSLRLRSTRRISSSAACESSSSLVTNVPPLRPRRDSTMPAASSMRSACWIVGRHLGVELQAEAPSYYVCLGPDLGVGDQPGARRKRERVEVPVEPGTGGDEVWLARLDCDPADLRAVGAKRLAAHRPREELAAEAQAEHRHVGLDRVAQEVGLAANEWLGVVEGGELRAERRDHVVVARIRNVVVEVDAEDLDVRVLLVEPLFQVAGRGRLFVLQDQGFEPVLAHETGLASSLLSSSFATRCSVSA